MTLKGGVFQLSLRVKCDLLVLRSDQVEDNMAAEFINAFSIAEPFTAVVVKAFDDSLYVMNSTVGALMRRKALKIVWFQRSIEASTRLNLINTGERARNFTQLVVRNVIQVLKSVSTTFQLIKLLIKIVCIVEILRADITFIVHAAQRNVIF